jgi:RNase P subunit RPR2
LSRIAQVVTAFERKLPVVTCPGCNTPMKPGRREAATRDLVNITYVCENCGTRTERTMKEETAGKAEGR